jgi:hypothetical protein
MLSRRRISVTLYVHCLSCVVTPYKTDHEGMMSEWFLTFRQTQLRRFVYDDSVHLSKRLQSLTRNSVPPYPTWTVLNNPTAYILLFYITYLNIKYTFPLLLCRNRNQQFYLRTGTEITLRETQISNNWIWLTTGWRQRLALLCHVVKFLTI